MNIQQSLSVFQQNHNVISVCHVDELSEDADIFRQQIDKFCRENHRLSYQDNDRIVFVITKDFYVDSQPGARLETIQRILNQVDISNYFVTILTTNQNIQDEILLLQKISTDQVPITYVKSDGVFEKIKGEKSKFVEYRYGSPDPVKISLQDLNDRERYLLVKSKVFCIYPWTHLHAWPSGDAYPCCHAEMGVGKVGNCREQTLQDIWNSPAQKKLRRDMLTETENPACGRCYEQEKSGFFSGRKSANKHHGHHVERVSATHPDGTYDDFSMTYWDIRFSNLCNLSCRSCGHIFSSSWHKDQKKLVIQTYWDRVKGPSWPAEPPMTIEEFEKLPANIKQELTVDFDGEILTHLDSIKKLPILNYAGRTETDIWEQLIFHLDHVEQIYFAGGEPLMMEEHYKILEELERREKFHVRLIYNTNFTHVKLKDRWVFDYWKKFDSVAVGASLDAMGPRAEYIRKGTDWHSVEKNREKMLRDCPNVDFYISPTLSILNALHVPDFHQDWVRKGLIKAQDLNVNILQNPVHLRIDIAPEAYKNKIEAKIKEHMAWLEPQDQLRRATVGFESALKFMRATDNQSLCEQFWDHTNRLDAIRNENVLQAIPELQDLK